MSLGLKRTEVLLTALGNPQRAYGGALVAGTNGKGSTCAMLSSMLSACGRRVGGNPSPPLTGIGDRFLLDSRPAPAWVLAEAAGRVGRALAVAGLECSEFEVVTAVAFEAFRLAGCDAVVAEVGLGGRWDSTNVFRPGTKVITGIDFDHTDLLGPDLWSIAREKSGIIHQGDTVAVPALPGDALRAVQERAAQVSARVRHVRDHVAVTARRAGWSGQEVDVEDARLGSFAVRLPVLGDHQAGNLATALCALGSVGEDLGIGLTREAVVAGVEDIRLPGWLEVIQRRADSSPALVVDVAHNVQSVRAAIELVQGLHPGPVVLLFGCYGDKDAAGMLAAVPGDWRCVWTRAPAPRGLPADARWPRSPRNRTCGRSSPATTRRNASTRPAG